MKSNILKAVASVATATTLLFTSATCFAADANTVTTYEEGKLQVVSTIKGVPAEQMVTYLASKTGSVSTKDDIVYITQWTSDEQDKTVSYTVKDANIGNVAAVVKYGSDNSDTANALNTADETKTVQVNRVNVEYDAGVASVTEGYVTTTNGTAITVELNGGYELDSVLVNGSAVEITDTLTFAVPVAEAPSLKITTKLAKAPVSAEETADLSKIDADITVYENGEKLPTLGKVVKLANVDETVIEYGIYVENAEGAFKFNEEDTNNGYYPAADANEDGYFAVNIASNLLTEGGYVAYPYYKTASETVVIGK